MSTDTNVTIGEAVEDRSATSYDLYSSRRAQPAQAYPHVKTEPVHGYATPGPSRPVTGVKRDADGFAIPSLPTQPPSATGSRTRAEIAGLKRRLAELEAREELYASKRREEIRALVVRAHELDLAFLLDVTGSMQSSIDTVRDKIRWIASGIQKEFPLLKLRVAFVGYRDYADTIPLVACDFTPLGAGGAGAFEATLAGVVANGGDDGPEDVFTGMEAAAALSWRSATRLLVHIADAPMHGLQYNGGLQDNFPAGDKLGRSGAVLLQRLRLQCRVSAYYFAHLNDCTRQMLAEFKRECGDAGWIQEQTLEDISRLPEAIVVMSVQTLRSTVGGVGGGAGGTHPYYGAAGGGAAAAGGDITPTVCVTEPDWRLVPQAYATACRAKALPAAELIRRIRNREALDTEPVAVGIWPLVLQIAPQPFSDKGAMRWPFYARLLSGSVDRAGASGWGGAGGGSGSGGGGGKYVVKRFKVPAGKNPTEVHRRSQYLEQMEVQAVSAALAEEFNAQIRGAGVAAKRVSFTQVATLTLAGRPDSETYCNLEPHLCGAFVRYTNNTGYVNAREHRATLQAFTHWTHEYSRGLLMVTDLQGVLSEADGRFLLCDPAIHCTDLLRFSRTNLGDTGFQLFFHTHACNEICAALRLPRRSTQADTGLAGAAAAGAGTAPRGTL